eukprot:scaffold339_cov402-Prasinococcus_capsulatus_cf.AAC.13
MTSSSSSSPPTYSSRTRYATALAVRRRAAYSTLRACCVGGRGDWYMVLRGEGGVGHGCLADEDSQESTAAA